MPTSGNIKLSEDVIVYETSTIGNSFELPLAQIKALFKYQHYENSQGYVIVNDKKSRKYIPLETDGLTIFIKDLATALELTKERFELDDGNEAKAVSRIYLKPDKKNYQILPETYAKDQAEGYEVIGAKSIFCKWDTSIDELEKLGVLAISPMGTSGKKIIISYPVRIGRILIDGLEITSSQQRRDYPVKTFYASINNAENTENSFYEVFSCLKQGASKNVKQSESITKDRMYIELSISDIVYQLTYDYSGLHNLEMGYSTLLIENQKVYYDRFRTFKQYHPIQLTTCLFFKEEVKIYKQLSNNQLIGLSPRGLWANQNQRATIWVDEDLGIIGFTHQEYSYIFELNRINHFSISNTRPAKGSGGASISTVFVEGREVVKSWLMFHGRYQSFDKAKAILEAMSGKPVQMEPEWLDD